MYDDSEDFGGVVQLLILPALGGLAGYLLKYYLDRRQQFATKNAEVKREAYQGFVNLMVDIFAKGESEDAVARLHVFYKSDILYASPGVIKAFAELMQYFYVVQDFTGDKKKLRGALRRVTKVFKCMRRDIGLSNRRLGREGEILFRALLKDYDDFMTPVWKKWSLSFDGYMDAKLRNLFSKIKSFFHK